MKASANKHDLLAIDNTNTVITYHKRSTSPGTDLIGQNKPSISKIGKRQFKNKNHLGLFLTIVNFQPKDYLG